MENTFETVFLIFVLKEEKPKTSVYSVISKSSNCELGEVKWHPGWRHYCFFPTTEYETVYSDRCLKEISNFITGLNGLHRELKHKIPFGGI